MDFDHDFLIAEHDNRVRALIRDDLGVANRDGFRRGVYRLGFELFGNVERTACARRGAGRSAGRARDTATCGCRRRRCPARLSRARARHRYRAFSARRRRLPRLSQRLDDDRQNFGRRNIIERASDWFGELDVRVELGDQSPDKRQVNRPRDDMDSIGAHVGGQFYFADHN